MQAGDMPTDVAAIASGLQERLVSHTPAGQPRIELRLLTRPEAAARTERLVGIATSALDLFGEWFGPYPGSRLTIIDAPWRSGLAGAAYPQVVVTSTRWIAPDRDLTSARSLIAAIAREYWLTGGPDRRDGWFEEGLMLYAGARGIHELLDTRNVTTPRYFGGFVPLPLRSLSLSFPPADPRPWSRHVVEVNEPATAPWRASSAAPGGQAQRAAVALHMIERYIGWPALQQALAAFREQRHGRPLSAQEFAAVVSDQRGSDLAWLFDEAFRVSARFDYGIEALSSEPSAGDASRIRTSVTVRRYGDGLFAGTSEARAAMPGGSRSLPVEVRFADGSRVRDGWDGRDVGGDFVYESRSRAVSASIDPDVVVLLDADRANNTRTLQPGWHEAGARLAFQWIVWLQDVMLSCTALA